MSSGNREVTNILAIESAVGGGSVALLRKDRPVVLRAEGNDSSRAEKLVSVIADVLNEAELGSSDLDLIAVSTGPGSYSGIRIGISTGIGLSNALSIPCDGVSVLEAMAFASGVSGPVLVAIPVGKNDAAWQRFEADGSGLPNPTTEPELLPLSLMAGEMRSQPPLVILAHSDLLDRISNQVPSGTQILNAGTGLAESVGRLGCRRDGRDRHLRPLYLRNRQAGHRPAIF